MGFLASVQEGGTFQVALADGGVLPVSAQPALPGTGTVTAVTGSNGIAITGSPTTTPNVTWAGLGDISSAGLVDSISGPSPIVITPAVLQFAQGTVAPTFSQAQQLAAAVPQPMGWACQLPGAGSSGANGTPGGYLFTIPAPVGAGSTEGFFQVASTGGLSAYIGVFPGAPTVLSCIWLGAAPGTTNFTLANEPTNGSVILNGISAASGINTLQFFLDGVTSVFTAGKDTAGGRGFDLATGASTNWGGGVKVVGLPNATTEPTTNVAAKTHFWSFTNGALKWRSANGWGGNLAALGAGSLNTQQPFIDTFSVPVRTVSTATPTAFPAYTCPFPALNTVGWINVRLKSKAATVGTGIAVGDGAMNEYRLGYKNVAGTVTLSTAGIQLLSGPQTTAVALTSTLTAAAVGGTIVFSVTNVALCTVDSLIDLTNDVC